MLAKEGAYSKAVSSLQTEVAAFSGEEEHQWTTTLLPQSTDPDAATSSDATMGAEDDDSENNRQPFRNSMSGIRFPAMSTAGPSGARLEHLEQNACHSPQVHSKRFV